jgi:large repetitive protein
MVMKVVSGRAATSTSRKRSLIAAVSTGAMALVGMAAVVAVTGGSASAATSNADVSVKQRISGGSSNGQTVDTLTIHNAGPSTANNVNLTMLQKSSSNFILTSANHGTCETEPPPTGYLGLATCQFGALASGATVVETITFTGQTGRAFSNYATVGVSSPVDLTLANNSNTVSSYFGPRADLGLSGTAAPGTKSGTAKAVTTVTNHGPNTAKALQLIVEITSTGWKGVTVSATPLSSCQIIPPASGYNGAVSCVTDALGTGKKWVLTFSYTGAKGAALTMKTTTSANTPADPKLSNNTMTKTTHMTS